MVVTVSTDAMDSRPISFRPVQIFPDEIEDLAGGQGLPQLAIETSV